MKRFGGWKALSVVGGGIGCGVLLAYVTRHRQTGVTAASPPPLGSGPSPGDPQGTDLTPDNMTLRCAQIFFRHGARTPLRHIPNVEEVSRGVNMTDSRQAKFVNLKTSVRGGSGFARGCYITNTS